MKPRAWRLDVWFSLPASEAGRRDTDRLVQKAAGRQCWASGAGLGQRDMAFDYDTADDARAAAGRIKKALSDVGAMCETDVWEEKGR